MRRDPEERAGTARNLSRREMLGLVGSTTAAVALAGCGTGGSGPAEATIAGTTAAGAKKAASCVLTPEATEGPYYLDLRKIREDITEDLQGVPLRLRTTVVNTADDCAPPKNAAVDIWHCNAVGDYSGFTGAGSAGGNTGEDATPEGAPPEGAPAGPPPGEDGSTGAEPTDGKTFLRGVQLTNADGVAEFETIYPGWYQGRVLHVHLKVIVDGNASGNTYEGGHVSHTGQLFFPEDVTDRVAQAEPYVQRSDVEIVRHAEDMIFQQAGEGSIVTLTGSIEDGFVAEITVGVDPDATLDPAGMGGVAAGGSEATEDATGQETAA